MTPRESQCACYIVKRNGMPFTSADYDKDSPSAPSHIIRCSSCLAREAAMVEALRDCERTVKSLAMMNPARRILTCGCLGTRIRAALALVDKRGA
jgi:hypothetical protein